MTVAGLCSQPRVKALWQTEQPLLCPPVGVGMLLAASLVTAALAATGDAPDASASPASVKSSFISRAPCCASAAPATGVNEATRPFLARIPQQTPCAAIVTAVNSTAVRA